MIAALALIVTVIAGAASTEAQVFVASRPSTQLAVTPLFVVASVTPVPRTSPSRSSSAC